MHVEGITLVGCPGGVIDNPVIRRQDASGMLPADPTRQNLVRAA